MPVRLCCLHCLILKTGRKQELLSGFRIKNQSRKMLPMISVAIIEDQSRYRDLLRLILSGSDHIQILFEREHCRNIIDDVVKDMPDVLIMDIDLPGKSGIDAVI